MTWSTSTVWDATFSASWYSVAAGNPSVATLNANPGGANPSTSNPAIVVSADTLPANTKTYFMIASSDGRNDDGVGLADVHATDTITDTSSLAYAFSSIQGIYVNGVLATSAYQPNGAACVGIAVDTLAKLAWWRYYDSLNNAYWNGSSLASPTTGVGGVDISGLTFPIRAMACNRFTTTILTLILQPPWCDATGSPFGGFGGQTNVSVISCCS